MGVNLYTDLMICGHLSLLTYRGQNIQSLLFYLQGMTLPTLLIPAVCGTRVYELRSGPHPPWSLWLSGSSFGTGLIVTKMFLAQMDGQ